jgi:lipopolysaccharide transport system ATP-binding protein
MNPETASVIVEHLTKEFRFYSRPWDRLVEWATLGRMRRGVPFKALDDVGFVVRPGGSLGIVGANGAGKSTLLKIVCGTMFPTSGRVAVRGRIASLLELGAGFHPDFTGRQNITLNARFLGLHEDEIREQMGAIIEFSELGDFIDRPLRSYSSGMWVRLAFAVAANVEPDVLVIDEALSVGDAYFQQKCVRRIRQFRESGTTILFVSHDPTAVRTLCDEALLLHEGRIRDHGRPEEVLETYNAFVARGVDSEALLERENGSSRQVPATGPRRSGSLGAVVQRVRLLDARGEECRAFVTGERGEIRVEIVFLEPIEDPTVGILIRDRLGNDVYGTNTFHHQISHGRFAPGESLQVSFRSRMDLGPGEYTLTVAVHTQDVHLYDCYDWIDRLLALKMIAPSAGRSIGPAYLRPEITWSREEGRLRLAELQEVLAPVLNGSAPKALRADEGSWPWLFSGWYPLEASEDGQFRWTEPRFSVLMDCRGTTLHLEIGTDRPLAGEGAEEIRLSVLDTPLGSVQLGSPGTWRTVSVEIPETLRAGVGLVRAETQGWTPRTELGTADARLLGVRVRRIWVD